jgi:hypothetical protein
MLMALPASERDVLVVDGLRPVFIVVFQCDGSRKWFSNVHVHTDACVRGIASLLSSL